MLAGGSSALLLSKTFISHPSTSLPDDTHMRDVVGLLSKSTCPFLSASVLSDTSAGFSPVGVWITAMVASAMP
ncbi:MAG: hypothetical protein BWY70_00848 [Bacteroidetes bacterium ADurb.Bin408]|nr:MAG: hypothetical protein BWY70_00848 [Bacteroidetes bacterium ADurb.Bin408]